MTAFLKSLGRLLIDAVVSIVIASAAIAIIYLLVDR